VANPLADVGEARVYTADRTAEVINIWCDLVGKLFIGKKTAMGHFPPIFSESLSSETTGPIEKIRGCKNGTMDILNIIFSHALSICRLVD